MTMKYYSTRHNYGENIFVLKPETELLLRGFSFDSRSIYSPSRGRLVSNLFTFHNVWDKKFRIVEDWIGLYSGLKACQIKDLTNKIVADVYFDMLDVCTEKKHLSEDLFEI